LIVEGEAIALDRLFAAAESHRCQKTHPQPFESYTAQACAAV
jgi:hypothetical protein